MKAHEWLADPAHWTQGINFRQPAEAAHRPFALGETESTCALGALLLCYHDPDAREAAIEQLAQAIGGNTRPGHARASVMLWNDERGRTHAEVYGVFLRHDL